MQLKPPVDKWNMNVPDRKRTLGNIGPTLPMLANDVVSMSCFLSAQ